MYDVDGRETEGADELLAGTSCCTQEMAGGRHLILDLEPATQVGTGLQIRDLTGKRASGEETKLSSHPSFRGQR